MRQFDTLLVLAENVERPSEGDLSGIRLDLIELFGF